jgi:hypothetical protein
VNGVSERYDAPDSNPKNEEEGQPQPYLTSNKFIFEIHILSFKSSLYFACFLYVLLALSFAFVSIYHPIFVKKGQKRSKKNVIWIGLGWKI